LEPNKSGIINATSYDISYDYLRFVTFDFFNIGFQEPNKNLDIIKKLKKVVNRNIKIEIAKLAGEKKEYITHPLDEPTKMFYLLQEAERTVIKKLINTSNEDIIKLVNTIKLKTHNRNPSKNNFCNIL
jgi:UDP-glucose 4-epimerase